MPWRPPPEVCPGIPERSVLAKGSEVWRVRPRELSSGERLAGWELNRTRPASAFEGGRFDPIEDGAPAHVYLAETEAGAVAEALLRALPVDDQAPRVLPRRVVEGRNLTRLEVLSSQPLVDLVGGKALGRLGQDSWLTKSEPRDYPHTREWGRAIREWCPWAAGFVWRSRLDEDVRAYVLFGDPSFRPVLEVTDACTLDGDEGLARLQPILAAYSATLDDSPSANP